MFVVSSERLKEGANIGETWQRADFQKLVAPRIYYQQNCACTALFASDRSSVDASEWIAVDVQQLCLVE